jgi:AraC-like DNA-binding protein/mannose-6-phosphate isomerase-like protein (cupin superfamily)
MKKPKEYEIVHHNAMNHLELFLVEMKSRNPHGHSDLEIGLVLEGDVELILETERITLHKNDIYVINRYQIHSFLSAGTRNVILAFQIHVEFYKVLSPDVARIQFKNILVPGTPLHQCFRADLLACAQAYYKEETHYELKCASLLFDCLYHLAAEGDGVFISSREYEQAREGTLRLKHITDYIAEHYTERITLDDIARLENITTYHASHFIKKTLGVSFQDYINHLRFEHALRLIRKTSLNILDICIESGFSSSRYLNQMFEKQFGMSASAYRKEGKWQPLLAPPLPTGDAQNRLPARTAREILSQFTA